MSSLEPTETSLTNGKKRKLCPYLDTINRSLLDFDFERSCSITLQSGPHIYGCLVCGKFFRGRGRHTPAFTHSVDENHCVFVHLSTGDFYCLPDNYQIIHNPSLHDISDALHPKFAPLEISQLDKKAELALDLFGKRYLPGFVGLNNLKKTDYVNAVVQALAHVRPLRDFFLQLGISTSDRKRIGGGDAGADDDKTNKKKTKKKNKKKKAPIEYSHLALCFAELMRKMWSDKRFKSNVDPHEMMQAVSVASKKRFHIGRQAEAGEFIAWLLHQLHIGIGGTRKPGSSVIHDIFQGKVEVTTRQRKQRTMEEEGIMEGDDRDGSDDEDARERKEQTRKRKAEEAEKIVIEEAVSSTHFLQLTLDIPEKPLFKDDDGGLVIPQEPLVSVLRKFDGTTFSDAVSRQNGAPQKRRYKIRELPKYLILHLARFKKNNFYTEKNPTIVAFPVKNLDLSKYVFPEEGREIIPTEEQVRAMSVKELKKLLTKHGHSDILATAIEKSDLIQACVDFCIKSLPQLLTDKYDLVANICHDSPAEVGREGKRDPLAEGSYRCHVQHMASNQWYEMQDLHVQETMAQLIGLSESYLLIFAKKDLLVENGTGNKISKE